MFYFIFKKTKNKQQTVLLSKNVKIRRCLNQSIFNKNNCNKNKTIIILDLALTERSSRSKRKFLIAKNDDKRFQNTISRHSADKKWPTGKTRKICKQPVDKVSFCF